MNERILDNKYIINKVIGTGGMSIVYSGFSMDTGEEVAIKILRPEYLEDDDFKRRFKKESKIAQNLSHRNIIKTIDTGEDEGLPYIVMEYVRGKTLKEIITERGKLTNEDAVKIGVKITEALFYAHSTNLIHRDIKPQNVLMRENGVLKVADFGIARLQDQGTITLGGSNVLGSVHYISPEQARGIHITKQADIYSLGVCLYEMVTGTVPFEGDSPVAVAIKHIQEEPVSPRMKNHNVSPALEEVILKAMSKEPEARYNNAFELGQDLKRALERPEGGFVKRSAVEHGKTMVNIPKITHEMEMRAQKERERFQHIEKRRQDSPRAYQRNKKSQSAVFSIIRIMLALILIVGIIITLFLIGQSLFKGEETLAVVEVPRVMSQSEGAAKQALIEAGFEVNVVYEYSQIVSESIVSRQDPASGEKLKQGLEVTIVVSLGKKIVAIPDVTGKDYTEAAYIIEQAELSVGDVSYENSEFPDDYVIRQDPLAGDEIPSGEQVDLVLSKNTVSTAVLMPDVMLKDFDSASNDVNAVGHEVFQRVEINGNEKSGTVIKQDPEAGAELKEDTQITLWVSNGQGAQYTKEYKVIVSVQSDDTHIVIDFVDGETSVRMYDSTLNKGEYEVPLTLKSNTWGEKEIYVYLNGEIYSNDRIYMAVEDG